MLALLDGGCRVTTMKDGQPELLGALRVWKHFGPESGAHAISLRALELPAGESATLHNESMEEVLYVVSGHGNVRTDDAIYLPPGQSFELRADETMTLVSSQCPEVNAATESSPDGGRPYVVSMLDCPIQRTGDRWYREVITADVTEFVGSIPRGRAPDHFHLYEEVICILEGQGVMWAGASHAPITAGSCIYLPIRQVHCVENRGRGELRLLGVFYPAGSPAVRYAAT
jgi:mannose-6-phosphate isomerase-like protein (cupin superfamily)